MISSGLGLLSLLMTGGALAAAYLQMGQAGKPVAIFGFLALLAACAGMYYGICGTKEEDVYLLLPRIGCGVNGILLAAYATIYVLGW